MGWNANRALGSGKNWRVSVLGEESMTKLILTNFVKKARKLVGERCMPHRNFKYHGLNLREPSGAPRF